MSSTRLITVSVLILFLGLSCARQVDQNKVLSWLEASKTKMQDKLIKRFGDDQKERIKQGVQQVADFWRTEDGNSEVFEAFIDRYFVGSQEKRDIMFNRYQWLSEKMNGHMLEILLALRWQMDLDIGEIEPFDEIFAAYASDAYAGGIRIGGLKIKRYARNNRFSSTFVQYDV